MRVEAVGTDSPCSSGSVHVEPKAKAQAAVQYRAAGRLRLMTLLMRRVEPLAVFRQTEVLPQQKDRER